MTWLQSAEFQPHQDSSHKSGTISRATVSDSVTVLEEAVTPRPGWAREKCPSWNAVSGLLCYRETFKIMENKLFLCWVEFLRKQHFNQNIEWHWTMILAFQFDRVSFILSAVPQIFILCERFFYKLHFHGQLIFNKILWNLENEHLCFNRYFIEPLLKS